MPHNYPEAKTKFSRPSLPFVLIYVCRSQLGRETCTDISIFVYSTKMILLPHVRKKLSVKLKTIPSQNMSLLN